MPRGVRWLLHPPPAPGALSRGCAKRMLTRADSDGGVGSVLQGPRSASGAAQAAPALCARRIAAPSLGRARARARLRRAPHVFELLAQLVAAAAEVLGLPQRRRGEEAREAAAACACLLAKLVMVGLFDCTVVVSGGAACGWGKSHIPHCGGFAQVPRLQRFLGLGCWPWR